VAHVNKYRSATRQYYTTQGVKATSRSSHFYHSKIVGRVAARLNAYHAACHQPRKRQDKRNDDNVYMCACQFSALLSLGRPAPATSTRVFTLILTTHCFLAGLRAARKKNTTGPSPQDRSDAEPPILSWRSTNTGAGPNRPFVSPVRPFRSPDLRNERNAHAITPRDTLVALRHYDLTTVPIIDVRDVPTTHVDDLHDGFARPD